MKTVLCYGDSNTYGYNPSNGFRYPEDVRWTCRLQRLLGDEYRIIEEGCNGRTTVFDDPLEGWKNGMDYLKPCLNSHKPLDIVVLMLGSNDLKETFHATAQQIADGAGTLVDVMQSFTKEKQGFVPVIVLISPPEIGEGIGSSSFYGAFCENSIERSREFPKWYGKVAEQKGCVFFDAAEVVKPSDIDSLHLSPKGHEILANELYKVIVGLENNQANVEGDPTKVEVPLEIVVGAIESVDDEWRQYLDIEKMEVIMLPEYPFEGDYDEDDQELSDLIEEGWNTRFFGLPSKYDVHEYSIMERFVWSLPEGGNQDRLESAIRGRGAFRRFKDNLIRMGIEQQWYDYQEKAYRDLAIEWCEAHGFRYIEKKNGK